MTTRYLRSCGAVASLLIACAAMAGDWAGDEDAIAALRETFERYRQVEQYRDRAELTMRYELGAAASPIISEVSRTMKLAFDGRGRVAMRSGLWTVVSDGAIVRCADMSGQRYTEASADEEFDLAPGGMASIILAQHGLTGVHPLAPLLDQRWATAPSPLTVITEVTDLRQERLRGRTCAVVSVMTDVAAEHAEAAMEGEAMLCPATLWIDRGTGLLAQVDIDLGPMLRAGLQSADEVLESTERISMIRRYVFEDVSLQALPDDAFAFDTAGMERVESLGFGFMDMFDEMLGDDDEEAWNEHARFVHEPVPPFEGVTLDGEAISTDALRGKVVLIDFWAKWCPPCVRAMPQMQKLSEEFADDGLVVLGINSDPVEQQDAVRTFLEEKGVSFPQIFDPDDEISRHYDVSGIPTTVLVDREGIVQSYHVGFGGIETYREEIRRVLAGEQLEKPKSPPMPLADERQVRPEMLSVADEASAPVSAWMGRRVESERGAELVVPADDGGLMRLNRERMRFEPLRLQGLGLRTVVGFMPHPDGGWIVASDEAEAYSDLQLAQFDASGRRQWSTDLGVSEDVEALYEVVIERADLDGDGAAEIVAFVGISASEGEQYVLMVVSAEGDVITRRTIEIDGIGGVEVYPGAPSRIVLIGLSEMMVIEMGL